MFKLKIGVVLGILLIAGTAWSTPLYLTVNNASFEEPQLDRTNATLGPQGYYAPSIFAWNYTGAAGTFQPNQENGPAFLANQIETGGHLATGATGVVAATNPVSPWNTQVAYLMNGGAMYQDIATLNAFGSFTVTVDVGHKSDIPDTGTWDIALTSSVTNTLLARLSGDLSGIGPGLWAAKTFTYTGATPVDEQLRIVITAAGRQVDFDNVSVLNNAPEIGGSSVFWTMVGVAGFWIYRKKRLVA